MIITVTRAHWATNNWPANYWSTTHWFRRVETIDTDTAPRTCLVGAFVEVVGLDGTFILVTPLAGSWPTCSA